jgi:hypothetical protein
MEQACLNGNVSPKNSNSWSDHIFIQAVIFIKKLQKNDARTPLADNETQTSCWSKRPYKNNP